MTSVTWMPDAGSIVGLDISIGSKQLLINTNFTIRRNDRIVLLGRNGSGKTTLLDWIASQRTEWSIYKVTQELLPTEQSSIAVVLSAHLERGQLWRRQTELENLPELTHSQVTEYDEIGQQLDAMQSQRDIPNARRILHGLGFSASQMDPPVSTLSGGWRTRLALAQGLFMEPDLLLLDEPTNHLDLDGVLWLTAYLTMWKKTFII